MPVNYENGHGGYAQFASYRLDLETWSLNINGEAIDVTNSSDGGYKSTILGTVSWDGSCKGSWDATVPPTTTLQAGTRGTVTLHCGATGKTYAGVCQLTTVTIDNNVKGAIGFSCSFEGSGAITYAS